MRSGGAELRTVLAAPRFAPAAWNDRRRIPATDPAGTGQGDVSAAAAERYRNGNGAVGCGRGGRAGGPGRAAIPPECVAAIEPRLAAAFRISFSIATNPNARCFA